MSAPARLEPETLTATLRAWGCPYSAADPRCRVWLEGYQAGTASGYRGAAKIIGVSLPGAKA